MKAKLTIFAVVATLAAINTVLAQSSAPPPMDDTIPVTVDNFIRAESDLYFTAVALKEDGFGQFEHHREVSPIDSQTIIRQNRDTLYSAAVFDLEAGPVMGQAEWAAAVGTDPTGREQEFRPMLIKI